MNNIPDFLEQRRLSYVRLAEEFGQANSSLFVASVFFNPLDNTPLDIRIKPKSNDTINNINVVLTFAKKHNLSSYIDVTEEADLELYPTGHTACVHLF